LIVECRGKVSAVLDEHGVDRHGHNRGPCMAVARRLPDFSMAFSLSYSGSECHGVDPLEQSPAATSFILVSASGLANQQKSLCRNNLRRRHQHDRLSISGEGEGTDSTSRSCGEVSTAQGLPSSAYSAEARGRSERMLGTLQDAKDLALAESPASPPPMISSSRSICRGTMPGSPRRPSRRTRSRWFGASRRDSVHRGGAGHGPPATIRLRMAIAGPTSTARAHYVKARVKVREYPNGTVFHGPRRIVDLAPRGVELTEIPTTRRVTLCSPSSRRGLATPAHAAPSPRAPSLTAAARAVTESRHVGTKKRSRA
jgi:hypothetical protein